MTHPRPPCILPVSTLACSKILVLFIQAWWEKLHSQKAPLILVWYSTPISFHSHIAYRTIFRHLSRSICRREDPLRFTCLFAYSEGRLELSFNTLFIISPATATARMTFPPADPVPGLNILPLFMDPNGLFPVHPYTPNFGTKFSQTEDNIMATSNLMLFL